MRERGRRGRGEERGCRKVSQVRGGVEGAVGVRSQEVSVEIHGAPIAVVALVSSGIR